MDTMRLTLCLNFMVRVNKLAEGMGLTPNEALAAVRTLMLAWTAGDLDESDEETLRRILMFLNGQLQAETVQ